MYDLPAVSQPFIVYETRIHKLCKNSGMARTQRTQDIGDRLRLVIEKTHGCERGAQAAWARHHHKTPQNANNWLRGLSYPDVELMIKLCAEEGFTLDWLYRGILAGVSVSWAEYLRSTKSASPAVLPAKARLAHEKTSS